MEELHGELADLAVVALGVRENNRLLVAVRLRRVGAITGLGRLTVVPDRQGQGIGSFLFRQGALVARCEASPNRDVQGSGSAADRMKTGYAYVLDVRQVLSVRF